MPKLCNLYAILSLALFQSINVLASPIPQSTSSRPNIADDSPGTSDENLPTTPNGSSNYVEPPAPSHSLLPHLSVPVQIALIAGGVAVCLVILVVIGLMYMRRKVKVEIKEERRKTALRMSMMQQVHTENARRRQSQMIILGQLEKLRDDPDERPALPPRASMMPIGGLQVQQAGLRSHNGSQVSFADGTKVPRISLTEEKVAEIQAEKRAIHHLNTQRKLGFA